MLLEKYIDFMNYVHRLYLAKVWSSLIFLKSYLKYFNPQKYYNIAKTVIIIIKKWTRNILPLVFQKYKQQMSNRNIKWY